MRAALLVLLLAAAPGASARELAVVAGEAFPVAQLSKSEVRDIFLGERILLAGKRLRPVTLRGEAKVLPSFLKTFLRVNEEGYESYWIRKVFQDGGTPPSTADSTEQVAQILRGDAAAIAFLWADDAAKLSGVRVLLKAEARE